MIESIWTYSIKAESRSEFEKRYSAEGDWARLFRRSAGYRGTRLLRDAAADHRYLTIDTWETLEALTSCKTRFAAEYADLDQLCSALTLDELHIGIFAALAQD